MKDKFAQKWTYKKQEVPNGLVSLTRILSTGGTFVKQNGVIGATLVEGNIMNMEYRRLD